jgi:hypothetical protein
MRGSSLRATCTPPFVHRGIDRKLAGHDHVVQVDHAPPFQLRAKTQIEIFRHGVATPAAGGLDRLAPPHATRAIEAQEALGPGARRLFDDEMAVEKNGLHAREPRGFSVQVAPTCLDDTDARLQQVWHGSFQEIGRWYEVGVEDRDEVATAVLHPRGQGARLIAAAVGAVQVLHVEPAPAQKRTCPPYELRRAVGRVVENLDLQALARVVEVCHRLEEPTRHETLVEQGQLHRDARPLAGIRRRREGASPSTQEQEKQERIRRVAGEMEERLDLHT